MPNYCEIGDTARVTFPDGSIQDFTNTPINISATRADGDDCDFVSGSYLAANSASPASVGLLRAPVYSIYRDFEPRFSGQRFFTRSSSSSTPDGGCDPTGQYIKTHGFANVSNADAPNHIIVDWWVIKNGVRQPPQYLIKVVETLSGLVVFSGKFSSPDYSVECMEGCPPNSLDCGDCCLPCDEIFNKISDIRRLLSRIR